MSYIHTVGGLISGCYDTLLAGRRQQITRLDGAILAAGTSLVITNIGAVGPGSFLGIDDELIYVESVNESARSCEIIRGMRETTAADHADAALAYVDPIFPRHAVRRALRDEVGSWPADIYRPVVTRFTRVGTGSTWWQLDPDYEPSIADHYVGIIDVTVNDDTNPARLRFDVSHQATNVGGLALEVDDLRIKTDYGGTSDLLVVLAARPRSTGSLWITDSNEFDATLNLDEDWADIAVMGACWRLMSGRDVGRSLIDAQPEPRRAEDVPAGFAGSVSTFFKRTRDARLAEEVVKLRYRWPLRRN